MQTLSSNDQHRKLRWHSILRRLQKNGFHQSSPQTRTNTTDRLCWRNDILPWINRPRNHGRYVWNIIEFIVINWPANLTQYSKDLAYTIWRQSHQLITNAWNSRPETNRDHTRNSKELEKLSGQLQRHQVLINLFFSPKLSIEHTRCYLKRTYTSVYKS